MYDEWYEDTQMNSPNNQGPLKTPSAQLLWYNNSPLSKFLFPVFPPGLMFVMIQSYSLSIRLDDGYHLSLRILTK